MGWSLLETTGQACRPAPRWEPRPQPLQARGAMRGIGDVEPTAAQARPAAGTWPRETWKARREPRGIRTFLISLTKLRSLRKRERHPSDPKAPISKKPGDLDEKLEGPCGLGCVVVPGCQRFNNIHCFLFFYCVLVTSQGKPEAQDLRSWGWGLERDRCVWTSPPGGPA